TRTKLRIHIHTDNPSNVFAKLENKGRLVYQKVDDMVMQKDIVNNRKADIALLTDSAADIPQELVDKYQIQVVPYRVQFGEQSFLDGLTLSSEDFYNKLANTKEIPQSAQPSYHDFLNRYNYLSSHYPSVIGLHLSKAMSGLWSNSFRAGNAIAKQQDKDISVINSKRLTSGEGLLVLRTAEAIHQGTDKETIVKNLNEWTDKTHMFVSTRTLKYMVRSGRVSPVKAAFGKLLNLKPVISVNNEGKAEVVAKPFTANGSVNAVLKFAKQVLANADNKIWGYAISHADNEKVALQYAEEMEKLTGMKPKFISRAAPVLALHVGRGVVALSIMES
ncbi:MAG: fatty acid-binding protein DegV, partial [Bacteroidia bacterium]